MTYRRPGGAGRHDSATTGRHLPAPGRGIVTPGTSPSVQDWVRLELIAHQTTQDEHGVITGCLCGWSELGASHAGHQAEMLARQGLLAADLG